MPIKIPSSLPAKQTLQSENIFIIDELRALQQDIRPLKIVILNLMPKKIETETQLLRLLSNTALQVDIDFLQMASHSSKNTPEDHLISFYDTFDHIKHKKYDGMIITGAPVEQLDFCEVTYWDELCQVMEWSKSNVFSTFHICWGAQAGLFYHYNIPKLPLSEKMFGIFPHTVNNPSHELVRGFDEYFYVPHSRHTKVSSKAIKSCPYLEILTTSSISGVHIVASRDKRQFFVTGHSEYDRDTLSNEYKRDIDKGLDIKVPFNYYPNDNPQNTPAFIWRSHANLLFSNWLNYFVYQQTPFDLESLSN